MIQERVIKILQLSSGRNQVVKGVNEMSQVQIPKLELIIFVTQVLTLSTASLVIKLIIASPNWPLGFGVGIGGRA